MRRASFLAAALFFIGSLVVLMVLALDASGTQAEPLVYVGQERVSTPLMRSLEGVAEEYWDARGVILPTPVVVWALPMGEDAGIGETPGDQVWLPFRYLGPLNAQNLGVRADDRGLLCEIYLHERGHNAGLSHEVGFRIMQAEASPNPPRRCLAWANHPYSSGKQEALRAFHFGGMAVGDARHASETMSLRRSATTIRLTRPAEPAGAMPQWSRGRSRRRMKIRQRW